MKTVVTTIVLFWSCLTFAQVGVGTTTPDATLDIEASNVVNPASNDGILIPRIDDFPSVNPTVNQDGMMVFVTGNGTPTKGFYYWDSSLSSWLSVKGVEKINDLSDAKSDDGGTLDGASIFIGIDAGSVDDGLNYNNALGYQALNAVTSGNLNSAIGGQSLFRNESGSSNIAIGYQAQFNNITGSDNIALGTNTLRSNQTGFQNTAVGTRSLSLNTSFLNTTLGANAFQNNTTGNSNVGIGGNSGGNNTGGSQNTFIGTNAGYTNLGSGNIMLGYQAGLNETGDNKLYIENSSANSDNALIYGDFGSNILRTNGEFQIGNPSGTGFSFPTSDGTTGQIMTTDGAGNVTFEDLPNNEDADWLDIGSSSVADDNNDDIYTLGKVNIGDNLSTSSMLRIFNAAADTPALSIYNTMTQNSGSIGQTNVTNNTTVTGSGTGSITGFSNSTSGTSSALIYNLSAESYVDGGTSNSAHILYRGLFSNTHGNGSRIGSSINFFWNAIGTGVTGSGDKIGYEVDINENIDGTHYGYYADVRKSTGYAAYLIGRTSLGTDFYNRYLMPENDGNANQVMTTDGAGNVTFQDLPTFTNTDEQDLGSNVITPNEEVEITISNGTNATINIQDADADATNEVITSAILNGTDLEIIEAGNTTSVNLAALQDGVGTDNQQIDTFSFNPATNQLTIELESDAQSPHNANLSGLEDADWYQLSTTNPTNTISASIYTENDVTINDGTLFVNSNKSEGIDIRIDELSLTRVGLNINLDGTSPTTGLSSFISNRDAMFSQANLTGIYQVFEGGNTSTQSVRGIRNWFQSGSTYAGTITGTLNDIDNEEDGEHFGVSNLLSGSGSGDKYGSHNIITTSAGGTHYGVYSSALKSGSYAGYFLGDVSIGTTNTNNYIFPSSRGSNDQILQTDASGILTWEDPSSVFTDTDNQQIDDFSFNSTTNLLSLELEDDGQAAQTVDLSSLNPTKSIARIYMLNSQTETGSGITKVNFDTVEFDTNSDFNTSTNVFTVPSDGMYRVTAQITLASSTGTGVFGVRVRVNGTQERRSEYNHHGNGELVRQVTSILNLTAGQTIDVAFVRPAVGATIEANSRGSFFEIEQL